MVREPEMTTNHFVLEECAFGIACVASRFDQIVRVIVLRQCGSSVHGKPPGVSIRQPASAQPALQPWHCGA
ncbi:hypothetical protein AERO9AM_70641 [Aeromicrobium sp. 9AM]|nr:hypothetical protein AERO9AM_70641 [Aeromicrobium sp. 9AM]